MKNVQINEERRKNGRDMRRYGFRGTARDSLTRKKKMGEDCKICIANLKLRYEFRVMQA